MDMIFAEHCFLPPNLLPVLFLRRNMAESTGRVTVPGLTAS
jgi:hypothetical protein